MCSLRKISGKKLAASWAIAALTLLTQGCANPGPPRPPSLHLPAQAAGLKADRIAGQVLLAWSTPDKTSDGLPLRGPVTAAVCREIVPSAGLNSAHPPACTTIARVSVAPGESHATDTLPPALALDPPQLLAYKVELLNPRGRSANASPPVYAAAGTAPETPSHVQISPSRKGALFQWNADGEAIQPEVRSSSAVELTRILIADANGPVSTTPSTGSQRKRPSPNAFQPNPTKSPAAPVTLRAHPPGIQPDPGGLLDPGALPRDTYTYTAQRVRTVTLQGHTLELRSAFSPPTTFTFRDVFPPAPPTGLETIASAPLAGAPSIDLSWEPNLEPDLLGYNIYRADAPSGLFRRLNPDPTPGPAFRDLTAQPGRAYRYRVTALDRNQNESSPSPEVRETLASPRP